MKNLKKMAIGIVVLLIVGYVGISWFLSSRVLFPVSSIEYTKKEIVENWHSTLEEELSVLPSPEDFSVETFDGLTLRGKFFVASDSSRCAIVFAHGWGDTWAGMLKYVSAFENCQCDYVFYDHRAHGQSEGKYATGSIYESRDLIAVTEWVRENKKYAPAQIAWMGSSWGAAAALMAGADSDAADVAFIIADAPYMNWYAAIFERAIRDYGRGVKLVAGGIMTTVRLRAGINPNMASPMRVASKIDKPVLLMHSKTDNSTAFSQSISIAEGLNDASEFYLTDWGNDHVMDVVKNEEEVRRLVTTFIEKRSPHFIMNKP